MAFSLLEFPLMTPNHAVSAMPSLESEPCARNRDFTGLPEDLSGSYKKDMANKQKNPCCECRARKVEITWFCGNDSLAVNGRIDSGCLSWQPYLKSLGRSAHINLSATSVTLIKNHNYKRSRRQNKIKKTKNTQNQECKSSQVW